MYASAEIQRALELVASGLNYSQISRELGISRAAIRSWHLDGPPRAHRSVANTCLRCSGYRFPMARATEYTYPYLLGLYLGDGSISRHPRGVYRLRVSLDRAYPRIVAECVAALAITMPRNKIGLVRASDQRLDVPYSYSRHLPCLFPQHGPGMKHRRRIVLEPWQREFLDRYPGRFLRGLIHSDGSRFINTIRHSKRTYRYPRYEFSNRSDDIRGLFCTYCDRLGIEWRPMNRWTISVARRDSVALLDRHVGPKR